MSAPTTHSPIAFAVDVRRLPKRGMPVTIVPDEAQREALAREHGLQAVREFRAELLVRDWKADGVAVTGRVRANIVQSCVLTLEPVEAKVDEEFEALFIPERSRLARPQTEGEMLLDAEGPDAPEIFSGDTIDVGAVTEEFFALGIDPYPRSASAPTAEEGAGEDDDSRRSDSPFAALRDVLRDR